MSAEQGVVGGTKRAQALAVLPSHPAAARRGKLKGLHCRRGNCIGGFFMSKMRNSKTITIAAMLISVAVILGFFKIPITNVIEIRFGSLPLAVAGSLLGPVVGGVVGGISDVLAYIVKPTGPFFPGFTINSILSGVIYGLTLKPDTDGNVSIKRIVISKLICTVLINMLLNTLWLSMLYGNAFKVLFFSRLPKEIIMFPVNTLLLIAVMKPMKKFFYQGVLN